MCAIAGTVSMAISEDTYRRMLKSMERRVPDASGVWQHEDTALLHSRLAIIDPEGGKQPMELSFEGEY